MSLTDRISALTPEQRALFEKLREKQRQAARILKPPPIPRVSGPTGEGDWPLSLDQERYWFMEQLYPDGAGLNITAASRMYGPLSAATVAAGLSEIVRRHGAWRTFFPIVDGRPMQRVVAAHRQLLQVIDLGGLPVERREPESLRLVAEDTAASFDLERGPLVRSSLVRLGADDHVCLLTVHHLVTDWISFQIVWTELGAFFAAKAGSGGAALPEPPLHYADFAVWQRNWLQGEVLDELTSWWREQLAGVPTALDLPTDRPRPAQLRMRGGRLSFEAVGELADGLRGLARQEGATLFMLVLAVTAALLHRDSGQERLILGANNANRNRPEIEPVLGCFLTQVPFAIDLTGDPTFRELLARVRQSALGALAHQDLPFGQLVQALQLDRDPSRQPLIQTLVQVLAGQSSTKAEALEGSSSEVVDSWDGRARYDLMLTLFEYPDRLSGALEYDADLFDAATTARRIERFLLQAAAAVADPSTPLSALPVLPEAARHQVAIEWNDTHRPRPAWTAPRRFAEQAARTPEALAVAAAGERLSYRELDQRSTALARRLRVLGIGAESRVALLLERTLDVPVAILGVWKAGGAYIPLDPDSPVDRLVDLLADAEPEIVIHRGALPAALVPCVPSLDLSELAFDAGAGSEVRLKSPDPADLAYLIYTSGTTGRPKAVMIEHGSLAGVLTSVIDRFALGPGDRVPHLSRYTFDASFLDLVAPLLAGAAVEVLAADEILDPASLLGALERSTVIFTVPALLRRTVPGARESGPERFAALRAIGVGADLVPPELQEDLLATFPAADLHVLYGPTEATILCAAHRVPRSRHPERALIGRPLPETELKVVDPRGAAVPLGVVGELWVGGPGVARGYFRRDELTAERFVVAGGRRYYRTGDLVRQVSDEGGALEFLGRTDLQVKVRGFRIEPGEIEFQLAAHPGVREAVVVARAGIGGDNLLVAYVVATGAGAPVEALRAFLRSRLPEYMVPAIFVPLAALPLSSNGKVDRKALPTPDAAREALAGSVAPRDAREELLAEIWRGVLGLDRVGIHDNFFQLGGDSILSIQVVARARQAGLLVTPRQLFENQTIAGLAAVSGSAGDAGQELAADQGPVSGEAPLTPIQRRFFAEERREPWRFNQAVLLIPRERLTTAPLAAALAGLAEHHDALRLRFAHQGRGWRQVHASAAALAAPLLEVDLTALPPAEGLAAAVEQLQSGLDLALGPLFTAALFRLGDEAGDRLLLTAHHLLVDGVSWRVLLEDLTTSYLALAAGATPVLPPKTTAWKRWAEHLAAHAGSAELAAELPRWLALPRSVPRLPRDFGGDRAAMATLSVELGPEETRALLQEVPEVYRTQVNDLLLAALALAFAAWTGEGTLLVDLEGHGREEVFPGVDLSRTVGWFTTLFPVALELPPGAGPREAIRRVKESLRAVPHRGLGYGLLRYLAGPETGERLAALPAREVSFNYLGRFDPAVGEGGLFAFAAEGVRGAEGEATSGRPLFAIDALVLGDRLRVNWTYDPGRHLAATAERLALGFLAEIVALIAHCRTSEAGGYTPSDFPLARIDQAALDQILGKDRGVEDLYPLAPLQQGILFHSLYAADADLYVEQLTAELAGPLDAPAFAAAWQRVVERHTALRTGFLWQEVERPLQLVRREAWLPWTVEDWRGVPPATLEPRWRALLAADRARGFDLGRPPLLRLAVVRTGEESHRLVWSSHHLIFDGWCFSILLTEVFTFYQAAVSGGEAILPPPRPFRDYIAWLAGRDEAEAERYWRRRLQGFAASTPVPFDAVASGDGSRADDYRELAVTLPAPRVVALEALAQRLQVTLNTLVQGAWALLLSRYSGAADVVFGAVVSGRPAELPGVESMVGLFINTLPVRVEVPEGESAGVWLARLQVDQFEMRQHEWTPLPRIQGLTEVPAGEPLFASLLAFENYPVDPAMSERLGELRVGAAAISERTNYPLTLTVVARGDLSLRLTADRRFEAATTKRILVHLENLLGALASGPEQPPGSLSLLAAAERHQLLTEWNDTATAWPAAASIPELFAAQAALRPEALALLGPGLQDRLSYGELDRRAAALAHELTRQGVGRGDFVGLFAERSAELVIAVLAVLRAGAAYVPLDPGYPRARLALMLSDLGPEPLVLVQPDLAALLPAGVARTLPLAPAIQETGSWATATVTGDDLAYVIYTSGSTGTPKGVAVPHRAVTRLVCDTGYATFGPDEVFLMMAPVSFDASTLELWGPLLNGGLLAILPPGEISLDGLERAIRDFGVTTLWLTAGLFHLVVDERLAALAPLRQLLAGGDVLSPPHVERLRRELPGLQLVNGYGPTENTTFTACHQVDGVEGGSVPIGRPIANTRVLVLDRGLEPAPVGVPGELYAGGAGLAEGYLGRPDLTASAFVPAPSGDPGERLYRTGDLVRRLPDGRLDFLGRLDGQVKVRGFRIEPGEIEAVLAAHPAVREAAVVAPRDGGRERRLVAYAVPRGGAVPAAAESVRGDLVARLPAYMVPADLVWLDSLPLSPTGKVDRAALLALAAERADVSDITLPRTAVEETLAAIWRQVLGLERVSVHDSFFRLGGDSILTIQVVARARQAGLVVTPRQIFEEQTIAGLAAVATPLAAAEAEQEAVEGDVPLTPVQRYFFAARPEDPHHFNQSLLLLLREPLAPAPLALALSALVTHHDALRLRFPAMEGGDRRAWNAPGDRSPLSALDLSTLPPARRAGALTAAAAALQAGFDLARGPLFRAARFVLGGVEPERLLLVAHHLVIDGVSWRVLLDDLETAYAQTAAGSSIALPAKTTSWKRWAERLGEHARSAAAGGEFSFWLSVPADVAPLPRDGNADCAADMAIGSVSTALGSEVTRALLAKAPAAYRTQVNDLLLAALARAFARWTAPVTGETRLRFDLEGHGREEIETGLDLSRTVGWFTTIFPVVLTADPNAELGDLLRAVKETLRAIPRHGIGYGLLRYLGTGEEAARLGADPPPEVAFNYLGQLDAALGTSARWGVAPEPAGPDQSPRARPRHSIEVNAFVLDGELRVSWTYAAARHSAATIERLAGDYVTALADLVAHCTAPGAGGWTPSDVPLALLDQRSLDALVGVGATLDRSIEDIYPPAPLQEGMLFQGLLAPDSELYFEHLTAEFEGRLDTIAFAQAWQAVVDRHPVLRTAFAWEGLERPLQVVRRGVELPWTEEDWTGVAPAEIPERLAAWLAADRARPFDLARPPLMRATLLRLGERQHRFVWSFHHLLLDGWCFSLIFGDVFAFYQAAVAGRAVHLQPVRPYRDFIAWVARQDATAAESYFRRSLAGFTTPTRLPLDRPGLAAGDDGEPRDQELRLSTALVAGLTDLAQGRGLTVNTLVQAAWALTIARYGGEPDVVFGTVVSGRPAALPGVESMIGLFINTLPVRLVADPVARLDAWLAGVQESLLELRQHETAALAQVQRASEVPPGEPLFQSLVAFENYPVDESLGEGADELAVTEVTVSDRTDYPLSLAVLPGRRAQSELSLRMAHDRRADATTVRRLLVHLERLLGAFIMAPDGLLGELPALSAAERHQLVLEWNDTATVDEDAATADLRLHDLVFAQARIRPSAVALAGGGREMTYGELDRCANQLANHLRGLGVRAESRVALLAERSVETVVAVLGILKAGGAYVPIDPATPSDRLAFLLADSRPALVVVGEGLADRLPVDLEPPVPVLGLDAAAWARIGTVSGEPPAAAGGPESLAYVIYTSGSTGTPKGVAVSHRSVVAYVRAVARRFGLAPGDRELLFSSLSFDASVEEIFAPLAAGAAVVPRGGPAEEPARFFADCAELGITVLSLPTAYWHQIAAALEAGALPPPPALRLIVIGGERALPDRWSGWGRGPGRRVRLINAYGPTEATISPTHHEYPGTPDPLDGRREVPIGRPLPGVRAYVVDRDLRLVPTGATGELLMGGSAPARGYLGRPALTAEKFVPDPFAGLLGELGARLYRTGDLARVLPDGTLEFAGRLDAQVKVRGFRVEPGEIETVLLTHPGLRAAAVVARRTPSGDSSLLACVVPVAAANPPGTAELRAFLAERLPAYMIPTVYAVVAELPLLSSGKVDRRALERLEVVRGDGVPGTPPGTPAEKAMAALWCQVLGVAEVRLEDDFFALGGHSLLATQLASRVRAAFGVDLPLRRLFEHPLLGDLTAALALDDAAMPGVAGALPQIPRRRADLGPVPASFAQERLWFLDRLQPGSAAYNMFDALRVRGDLSPAVLAAVLGEIVLRHEALRTTFQERAGKPVQVVASPVGWEVPLVDLTGLPAAARLPEAQRLIGEESSQPFDLTRGPLLRSLLLSLGVADHVLSLAMHHIVSDGWSMGVLVREITALYGAGLAGRPSPLPGLPIQYADFAVWQRQWLAGEELERQLAYWRRQLAGAPAAIDLPVDRPRQAAPGHQGAQVAALLDAATATGLSRLARGHEATLFMVVLAAFQSLLLRLTGQEDLPVGSPIANRNRTEIEPLIGFFVNSLVLRGDLKGDPPFRELLARVRQTTLDAYAHQDLPFERLVEELRPERSLAANPLFQIVCALQNAPAGGTELPGLSLSSIPWAITATRFDLELYAWEAPEGRLATSFVYSTELFDATTIQRLSGYLEILLRGVVDDPGRPVSALPLFPAAERQQILLEWNGVPAEPAATGLVAQVAAQAALAPEAPAVVMAGRTLTYGELLERASRIAGELRDLGVVVETPVGLLVERSPELVIGALAVLLAGGAYLPLDPAHPEERLAYMVRESGMPALLVRGPESPMWLGEGVRALRLDVPAGSPPSEPASADPNHLAYVVYTSGSTGRPKGVQVPHAGLLNLVQWHLRTYGVTAADRATLIASPAFDASVWEIWPYLAAGASLHIPDEEVRLTPGKLLAWLAAEGITLCFLPTPLAEQLLVACEDGLPPNLRLRALLTGGDRLQRRPRMDLPFALLNHYGPTESSVVATAGRVEPASASPRSPTIGRPMDGLTVRLLDERLQPVPFGSFGEILLGGAGLARGYLGRPDLTAERFVPDPFSRHPGERLYRTGDLARFLPKGDLEFRGRIDTQIKLRGFRIELGEIESTLRRHRQVREAVVALREEAGGASGRLVAYVVPGGEEPAGTADIGGYVAQWQTLYDETYGRGLSAESGTDLTFNIQGWDSSYTGEPISAEEMREWVDGTVERLLGLEHRRVLEVGCGTGLLLFRVAPGAERYRATDFSAVALAQIRAGLDRVPLPQVELVQRLADDWTGVRPGDFDLIVLNSVVQYFPDVDYLVRVLEGAVAAVAPGGSVFVGDVRSLPLLAAFHASIQIHQAADALSAAELVQRVRRHAADEEELVIDPGLFLALARRLPAVRRVQVLLKRGRRVNELNRFRYDAVLHVGEVSPAVEASREVQCWDDGLALGAIAERLAGGLADALAVSGIPNARLTGETVALELLASGEAEDVGALRAGVGRRAGELRAVDPEDLWALADRLGYDADLNWSPAGGADGRIDAVFRRRGAGIPPGVAAGPVVGEEPPWSAWANDPLHAGRERHLLPELRRFLAAELPEPMVPTDFVFLDALPLTPNGKVDRAALPVPENAGVSAGEWVAPATPLEELLARVAADVLGVERVGLRDNFFALGGHSLLATQLVSRLNQEHGVQVTLQMVFDSADLGEISDRVVELELASADAGLLDEAMREMDGLSPEELQALLEAADPEAER
jgi:amino acid adenylation domain-containing protein/non-ribosomal peptide synthase protein (TIGR01720 family)